MNREELINLLRSENDEDFQLAINMMRAANIEIPYDILMECCQKYMTRQVIKDLWERREEINKEFKDRINSGYE